MIKKLLIAGVVISLVVGCTAGLLLHRFLAWTNQPLATLGSEREMLFTLPSGQGVKQTAHVLEQEGLVSDALRFALLARIEKQDKSLKAGEYILSTAMSPRQILEQLVKGRVHLYRVTIPEGFTLIQISQTLSDAGLAPENDFLATALNPQTAKSLGIDADTLEGYIFPDTYFFPSGMDSMAIISAMVKQFRTAFTPQWQARAKELGMSVHEVVTLASIIEKETGAVEERPLISSVFHNRLKKGMRLETDPHGDLRHPRFRRQPQAQTP